MNVLMINPNRFRRHFAPIGLEYVCNSLLRENIEFEVIDFNFEPESVVDLKLKTKNVDLVGITIRNIDSAYLASNEFFLTPIKKLVERIKNKKNDCKVVLGGAGFSSMPLEVLEYTQADFGVVGYGEEALPQLVNALRSGGELGQINNLLWRNNGELKLNPRSTGVYEKLPARRRNIIRNKSYYRVRSVGNIETKRGCYRDCGYCCEPEILGRKIVTRNAESVITELRELKSLGIHHVYFCDSEFNVGSPDSLFGLCEQIKRNKLGLTWTVSMDPDQETITSKLLKLMKEAGCTEIFISADSGSEEILTSMDKKHTAEDTVVCSERIHNSGIRIAPSYLIGWPGETEKTIHETIEHVKRCRFEAASIWAGIRIYPNTKLADIAVKEGYITENTNFLKPIFYRPEIVLKEFIPIMQSKIKGLPNFILPSKVVDFKYQFERNVYLQGGFSGGFLDFVKHINCLKKKKAENIKIFIKTLLDYVLPPKLFPTRRLFIPTVDDDE